MLRRLPGTVRAAAISAILLWHCAGGPAETGSEAGQPQSFLLVTLDTTRADHLEPYGAAPGSSPALAALALQGVTFDRAYAVSPLTLPTHATLLTGLYPPQHGLRNNGRHHLPTEVRTLAERLREHGLRTAAFVSAAVLDRRYGLDQGFEIYEDDLAGGNREARMVPERPAARTVDLARAWLDSLGAEEPFFLWVHLFDPHASYAPPAPWDERFSGRAYAGEIAYMDAEIGRLLNHSRVAEVSATAVAAIADHGESLGEHGEQTHGLLAYDATLLIPWTLRLPAVPAAGRAAEPVSQIDLVPTLIDLFGLPPEPELPGASLLPQTRGEVAGTQTRSLYAESLLPYFAHGWARLRVLREGDWKYIEAPTAELYNMALDPRELENLLDLRPEGGALARRLAELVGELGDAQATVAGSEEEVERLRALGYVSGVAGRRRDSSVARPDPKEFIDLDRRLQQAEGLIGTGDLATAERLLNEIRTRDPGNLKVIDDLAQVLAERGRPDEAVDLLEEGLALAPDAPAFNLRLAALNAERGELAQALNRARTARDFDRRNLEPWLVMADYLARLGRASELPALYGDAREHLEAEPELHAGFGLRMARRQELGWEPGWEPVAEAALRRALVGGHGGRLGLHNALGDLLAASGRKEDAQREYELALGDEPVGRPGRHGRARALAALGRAEEAAAVWRQLDSEAPDAVARTSLAAVALERRDWPAALDWAEGALALDANDAAAWNSLGFALDELGRPDEALAAYERALGADRGYWPAAHNLGLARLGRGDPSGAATAFEEVLRREPGHVDAHFQLTLLYAGPLGDPGRALEHLDDCLSNAPNHPRARQLGELRARLLAVSAEAVQR